VTLAEIGKGVTPEEAVEAYRHVKGADIELSAYLMVGVAGIERWKISTNSSGWSRKRRSSTRNRISSRWPGYRIVL